MPGEQSHGAGRLIQPIHILMVVIGIITAAVVFFAFPDRHNSLVDESTIFANRVRAARDAAVVDGRPVRLWITPAGYGFEERSENGWFPMTEIGLRRRRWHADMKVTMSNPADRTNVAFTQAGSADQALNVSFTHGQDVIRVTITKDGKVSTIG